MVAGASGAGALYAVVVSERASLDVLGSALLDAACDDLKSLGARFALAEVAESGATLREYRELLESGGFREEGRVADYFSDGIALLLLRRTVA